MSKLSDGKVFVAGGYDDDGQFDAKAAEFGLEYDRKPPHYLLSTNSFPYEEVRKAEILAESISREYNVPE